MVRTIAHHRPAPIIDIPVEASFIRSTRDTCLADNTAIRAWQGLLHSGRGVRCIYTRRLEWNIDRPEDARGVVSVLAPWIAERDL
jgi:hypothetical protein